MTKISHRYNHGERVLFRPSGALSRFEGERQFPVSTDGPSYLIKRVKDGHECVAPERELAPVPGFC